MTVALETKTLSKIYPSEGRDVRAVDGVSVQIESGEFVALVGPSGSGKTTMLAMLAGLLRPSEGEALLNAQNLGDMSDADLTAFRLKNIGFTFQSNNLVPYLSALENVELMLRLNKKLDKSGKDRARELLERLGLGERLGNLPSELSGGQQQRVAIARALVHNPSLVLADEPTANLDTERAFQVVQTFADLIREQQRAGIMVTHDLRITRYVDRVIKMVDGSIIEELTDPDDIAALASTAL